MKTITPSLFTLILLISLAFAESPPEPAPMVLIPEGEFVIGSNDAQIDAAIAFCKGFHKDCRRSWHAGEIPQKTVFLDAFYIDKMEVDITNFVVFLNDYGNKCGNGPCFSDPSFENILRQKNGKWTFVKGYQNNPATDITWEGAAAYCKWAGKRLPTEAEWEKAARGTDGRMFPWGGKWDQKKANFCDRNCPHDWGTKNEKINYLDLPSDNQAKSAAAGAFPEGKSPYGILNMAGNAWEWVADYYAHDAYENMNERNPKGPAKGRTHVLRGGGWNASPYHLRAAGRFRGGDGIAKGARGFRCAKDAD